MRLAGTEHGPQPADIDELELREALDDAVKKLKKLNAAPCTRSEFSNFAYLGTETLEESIRAGVQWTIPMDRVDGRVDALELRKLASEVCGRLDGRATVHGDAHLRNILVRGREAHFIDYAFSGPGHPCFDLARLAMSLLFQCMRMLDDEHSLSSVIRTAMIDGAAYDAIAREFPGWVSSVGNRLALRACVSCREAALGLLSIYGGTRQDYLAVCFVMACQALLLPSVQGGVVRATIRALAPHIEADKS